MYPKFLGIGAQKAGTTWLHENLRRHPQIWLPPVKEIHYFDHRPPRLHKRLFGSPGHLRSARANLRAQLLGLVRGGAASDLRWALRHCLAPRNDDWYQALFADGEGKITGEICPGYARLDARTVSEVHRRMPEAKILYLLRDPIDRSWSSVAMHFRKAGDQRIEDMDDEAIRAHLLRDKTRRHDEYLRSLESWSSHYREEQLFIGFFDDLAEDPRAFFQSVLAFLGADVDESLLPASVAERRNPSLGEKIPPRFARLLAELHRESIERLDDHFDNRHTRRWREHARRCLAS